MAFSKAFLEESVVIARKPLSYKGYPIDRDGPDFIAVVFLGAAGMVTYRRSRLKDLQVVLDFVDAL